MKLKQLFTITDIHLPGRGTANDTARYVLDENGYVMNYDGGNTVHIARADGAGDAVLVPLANVKDMIPRRGEDAPATATPARPRGRRS